jgi:hypothetical protein
MLSSLRKNVAVVSMSLDAARLRAEPQLIMGNTGETTRQPTLTA